ncbi:aryl-sulfate sulfotransferase [candidate division KSB1 bacterium]
MIRRVLILMIVWLLTGAVSIASAAIQPADGDTLTAIQILFQWEPDPSAARYELEITRLGGGMAAETVFAPVTTDSTYAILGYIFEFGGSYSWRCRRIDNTGTEGPWGDSRTFHLEELQFAPEFRIENNYPFDYQPGLTLFNVDPDYFMAVDRLGKPVWFLAAKAHWHPTLLDNGHLLYVIHNGPIHEVSLNGRTTYFKSAPDFQYHHDVASMPDSSYLSIRRMKEVLPLISGDVNTTIDWQGDQVDHIDSDGSIIWSWNSFDHLSTADFDTSHVPLRTNYFDWTHTNTCLYLPDENAVLLSIRNLARLIKVDYASGEIIWSLGAKMQSGLAPYGDGLFYYQHAPEPLANGNILLFNNGGTFGINSSAISRAIEIAYDDSDSTASIVWQFDVGAFSPAHGDADRLPDGNTLITADEWQNKRCTLWEVDQSGNVVWKLAYDFNTYRADRIPGLYPQVSVNDVDNPYFYGVSPMSNRGINNLRLSYTLNESILKGWITYTWTGGTEDPDSPHLRLLYGAELNSGEHDRISLSDPPDLVDGAVYTISFQGSDFAGNESDEVSRTGLLYDISAPATPGDFTARAGDSRIGLTWRPSPEDDLDYYVIYRDTTTNLASADSIARIGPPDTTFVDSGLVNSTAYYYWIAAVDTVGNIGVKSDSVRGIPGTPPVLTSFPDTVFAEDDSLVIPLGDLWSHVHDNEYPDSLIVWTYEPAESLITTMDVNGLTLTAPANWFGTDVLGTIATDPAGLSDSTSWNVAVTPVNDSPVIIGLPDTGLVAGDSIHIHLNAFSFDFDDPDSNLTWSVSGDSLVQTSLDNVSNEVLFWVEQYWSGSETMVFTVTDTAGTSDTDTMVVSVVVVPIKLGTLPDTTFAEDDSLYVGFNFLSSFVEDKVGSDSLLAWNFNSGAGLMATPDSAGVFLSAPSNWYGLDTLAVEVYDPIGFSDTTDWVIRALSVNDPPVVSFPDTGFAMNGSMSLSLDDFVLDYDCPDSTLAWRVFAGEHVSADLDDLSRVVTLGAPPNWIGSDRLILEATDDSSAAVSDTMTVTVYESSTYLPGRFQWFKGAPMPVPRRNCAVGVVDGEIYVLGGETDTSMSADLAIYDPRKDQWRTGAAMERERGSFGAVVVDDILYAVGGGTDSVEAYDPAAGSWQGRASMPEAKRGHGLAAVGGKIYVIGGRPISGTYVYDPVTDLWEIRKPVPYIRWGVGVGVIDGKIYVAGGYHDYDEDMEPYSSRLDIYDPDSGAWTQKKSMNKARAWASAAVRAGKLYLIGGEDQRGMRSDIEEYDPVKDIWTTVDDLPTPRSQLPPTSASIDGDLYIIGGEDPDGLSADVDIKRDVSGIYYPPVLFPLGDTTFAEDDSLVVKFTWLDSLAIDVESPDSSLGWSFQFDGPIDVSQSTDSVVISSASNWFGSDTLLVILWDEHSLSDSTGWIISVTPVNDPPVVYDLPDTGFTAGDSLLIDLDDYVLDVDDPDSNLSWTVSGNDTISAVIDPAARAVLLKVKSNWVGSEALVLMATDTSGSSGRDTMIVDVGAASGLFDRFSSDLPERFSLSQNYPNPFNIETNISFDLPRASEVSLRIYNIRGQLVRRLVQGKRPAGRYVVTWKGDDEQGTSAPSGVYFYEIRAGDFIDRKRMVLLK